MGAGVGYGSTAANVLGAAGNIGTFNIALRGGLIIPLSKNVGLDIGNRSDGLMGDGSTALHVPLGFLGIRRFFP